MEVKVNQKVESDNLIYVFVDLLLLKYKCGNTSVFFICQAGGPRGRGLWGGGPTVHPAL